VANEAIEPDATIVSCPFSIIITPLLAKDALLSILQQLDDCESDAASTNAAILDILYRWTERQLIIVYICFHWIASPEM
jgi:hypothetical protein